MRHLRAWMTVFGLHKSEFTSCFSGEAEQNRRRGFHNVHVWALPFLGAEPQKYGLQAADDLA